MKSFGGSLAFATVSGDFILSRGLLTFFNAKSFPKQLLIASHLLLKKKYKQTLAFLFAHDKEQPFHHG